MDPDYSWFLFYETQQNSEARNHSILFLQVASQLEDAVTSALDNGYRTADLYSEGKKKVGCQQMGEILQGYIREPAHA